MNWILRILILCITVLAAIGAIAQEASVKSFEAALTDLTAAKAQRLDANGDRCALIKVQLIANNVKFQGSIVGDIEKEPGQFLVYMVRNTKMLQILSDSFKPLMVNFPEPLKPGVTYVLDITVPQVAAPSHSNTLKSYFSLIATPSNARIFIDGEECATTDGRVNRALSSGTHTYRVEAFCHIPEEGIVTIEGKKVVKNVNLKSIMPKLTINSVTSGTEIFINDTQYGIDRWNGELSPATYILEGRKSGYRTYSQEILLEVNDVKTVTIPELQAKAGSLDIQYKPDDSSIEIDGKAVGTTPDIINGLSVGTHTVIISKKGFKSSNKLTVEIEDGKTAALSGELIPKSPTPSPQKQNDNDKDEINIKPEESDGKKDRLVDDLERYCNEGLTAFEEYDKEVQKLLKNHTKIDPVKIGNTLLNGYKALLNAHSLLDSISDKNDDIIQKYTQRMLKVLKEHIDDFYAIGSDLFYAEKFTEAYDFYMIYTEIPNQTFMANNDGISQENLANAYYYAALAAYNTNDVLKAAETFRKARNAGHNNISVYTNEIVCWQLVLEQHLSSAQTAKERILEVANEGIKKFGDKDILFIFNKVNYLVEDKKYDEAKDAISRLIDINPQNPKLYSLRAYVNELKHDDQATVEDYRKYVSLQGSDYDTLKAAAKKFYSIGTEMRDQINGDDESANKAKIDIKTNYFEVAKKVAERARSIKATDPAIQNLIERIDYAIANYFN